MKFQKLKKFQTKKLFQLEKDEVRWSETIFSFWSSNVFPIQIWDRFQTFQAKIHLSYNKIKHCHHPPRPCFSALCPSKLLFLLNLTCKTFNSWKVIRIDIHWKNKLVKTVNSVKCMEDSDTIDHSDSENLVLRTYKLMNLH